mmetsp:Transcript_26711/g.69086  ORF Transcript_26711/g.69086 Transcript_26711/m.69086 type:complete len:205 (+) Transcript_26711:39-653(+)
MAPCSMLAPSFAEAMIHRSLHHCDCALSPVEAHHRRGRQPRRPGIREFCAGCSGRSRSRPPTSFSASAWRTSLRGLRCRRESWRWHRLSSVLKPCKMRLRASRESWRAHSGQGWKTTGGPPTCSARPLRKLLRQDNSAASCELVKTGRRFLQEICVQQSPRSSSGSRNSKSSRPRSRKRRWSCRRLSTSCAFRPSGRSAIGTPR